MGQKFSDGARAELAADISDTATSLTITAGGALFPVANIGDGPPNDDWFKLVLQDAAGIEIVYVAGHAAGSNTFTGLYRGAEGTTARAWTAPAVVGLRMTATDAGAWRAAVDAALYNSSWTTDFTASVGASYWLSGSYVVTLPASTGLPAGIMVRFMKAQAATPTIQVGAGTATIKTAKGSDTSVIFDVDAGLTFVFNGTDWEV